MPSAIKATALSISTCSSMTPPGGGRDTWAFTTRAPRSSLRRRASPTCGRTPGTASTGSRGRGREAARRTLDRAGGSLRIPGRRDHETTIAAIHRAMAYVPPKLGTAFDHTVTRRRRTVGLLTVPSADCERHVLHFESLDDASARPVAGAVRQDEDFDLRDSRARKRCRAVGGSDDAREPMAARVVTLITAAAPASCWRDDLRRYSREQVIEHSARKVARTQHDCETLADCSAARRTRGPVASSSLGRDPGPCSEYSTR